jgi:hypothetical protein
MLSHVARAPITKTQIREERNYVRNFNLATKNYEDFKQNLDFFNPFDQREIILK